MSEITTSALAARLVLAKQYNAAVHQNAAITINAYSRAASKVISGYAEIDASVAGLIQGIIYLAIQGERQGGEIMDQMAVKAVVYPVVFSAPATGPEADAEEETVKILRSLLALEGHAAQVFGDAAQEAAAEEIGVVVNLAAVASVSKGRMREIRRILDAVTGGTFWEHPEPTRWSCMRCGAAVQAPQAWAECPCCQAGRAFASAN